jgi:hypothetical protein
MLAHCRRDVALKHGAPATPLWSLGAALRLQGEEEERLPGR